MHSDINLQTRHKSVILCASNTSIGVGTSGAEGDIAPPKYLAEGPNIATVLSQECLHVDLCGNSISRYIA